MKKKCNICKGYFLDYLDLGKQPCADTFLKNKKTALKLKKYPLVVGFCKCSHLTAIHSIKPQEFYQKFPYSYTSSNSKVSRNHFRSIAKKISKKFKVNKSSFVVEAGSNDGFFLKNIKRFSNCKVLGIDPSKNMCELAKKNNIKTINNFFNLNTAKYIKKKFGSAKIFYAANVLNHVDDNLDFLKAANFLININGVLIIEVPDLYSLVKKCGFDTIYHEHRHYYSEKSIVKILQKTNFKIIKIEKINYMAGSIRVFAIKKTKNKLNYKKKNQIISIQDFKKFKLQIPLISNIIKNFLINAKNSNQKVYGIGAATKGNTLLNFCKINDKLIYRILDKSRYKIGKFTPGSAIKIIDENKVKKVKNALILPWNIKKYLLKRKVFSYISIEDAFNQL